MALILEWMGAIDMALCSDEPPDSTASEAAGSERAAGDRGGTPADTTPELGELADVPFDAEEEPDSATPELGELADLAFDEEEAPAPKVPGVGGSDGVPAGGHEARKLPSTTRPSRPRRASTSPREPSSSSDLRARPHARREAGDPAGTRSARRGFPGAWVVVSACVLAVSLLWVAMELQRGDQRAGEEAPAPGSPEQPVTGRPAGQEHRLTVELEPVEGTQAELRVSVTNQGDDEVSVALGHAPWPPVGESEPANAYRVVVLATGTSLERPAPVLGTYRFEGQSSQTWRTTLRPGDQARVAIDLASTPQPALALARVVVENAAATDRTECPMLPASVSSSGLSLADRSTPQAPPASAGRPPAPAASAPLPPGAHAPSEATEPSSTQLTSEETRRFELGRATEHRRRGEYAEARRVLDALIRQDPADVEAHHLLGWVCSDLGDDDAARMEFTAVVSLAAPTSEMYRTDKEALERLSGR